MLRYCEVNTAVLPRYQYGITVLPLQYHDITMVATLHHGNTMVLASQYCSVTTVAICIPTMVVARGSTMVPLDVIDLQQLLAHIMPTPLALL